MLIRKESNITQLALDQAPFLCFRRVSPPLSLTANIGLSDTTIVEGYSRRRRQENADEHMGRILLVA